MEYIKDKLKSVGDHIAPLVGDHITSSVGDGVNHYQSLHANLNKLKRKCEELNCRKEDVESQTKTELKPGKKVKEEVKLWCTTVQRINEETQCIEKQAKGVGYLEGSRLGKRVVEKIQEVAEHHQKGSFSDGLVVDESPSSGLMLPTTTLAGETTTKKNMEEIWDCLMNDDIRSIGVYGLGGIGKTTIMKHINNRLLKETDKFNNVFWVTVSKGVDVFKLQDAIARVINGDLSRCECETTRAASLFSKLSEKKRYVFILDDVWEAFELENVGIPEPTLDNGCKIVLTTRSLDVCRRMNCKNLKMELLSEEEAWNLFSDKVGRDVLSTPGLEPIMKLVAKECARLPLAVVTIGGSMKGVVDECEWRNVLKELSESIGGLNDMGKVIEQLKYSYIRLKDEKLQQSLLYCALFPEDSVIGRVELIKHLIVEGIIEGGTSIRAEFDKGNSLLNKLENACLLENCTKHEGGKYVKMHDLIRDMALQIMGRRCMVKARVQLRDLPDEEQWTKDLEKVSLVDNYIWEIPSRASPMCSRLSTLWLSGNKLSSIPDSFFVHMHGLKVLDLSEITSLERLPNSISDLENLTALLLSRCENLKCMPSLAKLRALRMLDLSFCSMIEDPQGMEMLVNLRWLDLTWTNIMIPEGLLPELSRLQYLVLPGLVNASEVADLRKLETFACEFDLHEFNTFVRSWQGRGPLIYLLQVGELAEPASFFDELGCLGNWGHVEGEKRLGKSVALRCCNISKGGEDPLVLPKDIELLEINQCHDVSSLCDVSSLNNASDFLQSCSIRHCDGIECVLSSSCTPLQSLDKLHLCELQNLQILFRGEGASPPPPGTFSRLKELFISKCPKIMKLFTPELLPYLRNLEQIRVLDCKEMEEIVAEREDEMDESSSHSNILDNDDSITTIILPKLRILDLENLPELKSIVCRGGTLVCDSLEKIRIYNCPELKRLPLFLPMLNGQPSPPPALQCMQHNKEWWESLEWDYPYAKDVLQPFHEACCKSFFGDFERFFQPYLDSIRGQPVR